ncbi:DegT/DnrJ/EryC1/StrS family aminotransferase, partial [Francisella philomiragia]
QKRVQYALNNQDIFPRRYFYPSLDTLNYIEPKQYMPISRDISKRIMCLPIYHGLGKGEQERMIEIIKRVLR